VPCLTQDCPHCPATVQNLKVYAPALVWLQQSNGIATWVTVVLELPESALNQLPPGDPRGLVFRLRRRGPRANSPLEVELHPDPRGRPILERLWGFRERVLPFPQRPSPRKAAKGGAS
jgi:hypothetical protein